MKEHAESSPAKANEAEIWQKCGRNTSEAGRTRSRQAAAYNSSLSAVSSCSCSPLTLSQGSLSACVSAAEFLHTRLRCCTLHSCNIDLLSAAACLGQSELPPKC